MESSHIPIVMDNKKWIRRVSRRRARAVIAFLKLNIPINNIKAIIKRIGVKRNYARSVLTSKPLIRSAGEQLGDATLFAGPLRSREKEGEGIGYPFLSGTLNVSGKNRGTTIRCLVFNKQICGLTSAQTAHRREN